MSKPTRKEESDIDQLQRKDRIRVETESRPRNDFEWKEFWRSETLQGDVKIRQLEARIEKQTLELEAQKRIMLKYTDELEAEIACLQAEKSKTEIDKDYVLQMWATLEGHIKKGSFEIIQDIMHKFCLERPAREDKERRDLETYWKKECAEIEAEKGACEKEAFEAGVRLCSIAGTHGKIPNVICISDRIIEDGYKDWQRSREK